MTDTPALADVLNAVELLYPARLAESWDASGLVCGDPAQQVRRVLVAVDPVAEVVEQAIEADVDLLLCHHPLLLRPVHSVATTTPAGWVLSRLIRAGVALLSAHTNADAARPGVSDALASALGVGDTTVLQRVPDDDPAALFVVYVPAEAADALLDAAAAAGGGVVGDYRRCAFRSTGTGTYEVPLDGDPYLGTPGERCGAGEERLEFTLPQSSIPAVIAAVRAVHPYEEPAYEVLPMLAGPRHTGIGRVGELSSPVTLADFAEVVSRALPRTAHGVRVAGDPEAVVSRVAVCGGSGDSLLADARAAAADVYVTSDLRHHRVLDHLAAGGCPVIDVAHFVSEWPWCPQVAGLLGGALDQVRPGATVEVLVSDLGTDPWTFRQEGP